MGRDDPATCRKAGCRPTKGLLSVLGAEVGVLNMFQMYISTAWWQWKMYHHQEQDIVTHRSQRPAAPEDTVVVSRDSVKSVLQELANDDDFVTMVWQPLSDVRTA